MQLDDSPVLRFSAYVDLDDPGFKPLHIVANDCSDWLSRGGLDCDRAQVGAYRRMKQARSQEELRQTRQWLRDGDGQAEGEAASLLSVEDEGVAVEAAVQVEFELLLRRMAKASV